MSKSFFQLGHSAWWLIVIFLVSSGIAYFLYTKKNVPWNTIQNWILFGLRTLAISLLLLLLLEPSIKKIANRIEKPIMALAIDNSQSITARGADSTQLAAKIANLRQRLEEQDFEVQFYSLSPDDDLQFNRQTTQLSGLLSKVDKSTQPQNLAGLILLTDGIFNRGSSPLYRNYLQPVFTVGLGDTIPPKDVSISRIRYNRVTFNGNQTPIRLEINQQGYLNATATVTLSEGGAQLAEKNVRFTSNVQEVEFLVSSEEEGLRHLVVAVSQQQDESTYENNQADIFMEVIDGKQKVLIVSTTPHPDIKALRNSLEKTDSYATDLYIPSIHEEKPSTIYDVVIYHGAFKSGLDYQPKEQPGIWYILDSESAINTLNSTLNFLSIEKRSGQPDRVTGSFNQNFSKFKTEDMGIFEDYPPIEVPFGDYVVSGSSEVLMFQKLGSVVTRKPLMLFNDDGTTKSAVLVGSNIWRWKLQEAAINDNAQQFDNFIIKTIQFLSVKNDKKQFRFQTRSSTFDSFSPVLFDAEVYNEIYERIYGNLIAITITDETNNPSTYEFIDSEINTSFKAPTLAPGIYRYRAQVQIGEETFTEQGEFLIEDVNPEYQELTANHRLLRNLSAKTGGQFLHYNDIDSAPDLIESYQFRPIMKSQEEQLPLAKSWWYFLIIILLFSSEWLLRRYWGGY